MTVISKCTRNVGNGGTKTENADVESMMIPSLAARWSAFQLSLLTISTLAPALTRIFMTSRFPFIADPMEMVCFGL